MDRAILALLVGSWPAERRHADLEPDEAPTTPDLPPIGGEAPPRYTRPVSLRTATITPPPAGSRS